MKPRLTIRSRRTGRARTRVESAEGSIQGPAPAILLAADAGVSDDDIAASVGGGRSTVYRTKQRFVFGNLKAALNEAPGSEP
jgi:hypothetical protein